jgi:eukaryotic-like serine/threonine-protein kinase
VRASRLSVHYFAPEQILGDFFDARSDVFSVAMVAYQLLADRYPFDVPDGILPREIVNSDPELLGKVGAWIPGDLEQLVARALRRDPAERVQTVHEFAVGLRRIAEQMSAKPVAVAAAEPQRPAMTLTSVPKEPPVAQPVVPAAVALPALARSVAEQPAVEQPAASQPASPQSMPPLTVPPLLHTRPQPAKPPSRPKHSRKRAVTFIAAGLITIGLSGAFLIRNGVVASPAQPPAAPVTETKVEKPAPPTPAPVETIPVVAAATQAPATPQAPDEKAKLDLVKSLWESGQYTPALRLVDEVLAANAASVDGRAWRRKIRAAQQAEADLK